MSAYETVFGQTLHHQYSCSREEAQRCWTVDDILLVTKDDRFHSNIVADYDLRVNDNTEESQDDDPDSGYFSDDDIPTSEDEEVSDDFFYAHLMDDIDEDMQLSINDRKAPSFLNKCWCFDRKRLFL